MRLDHFPRTAWTVLAVASFMTGCVSTPQTPPIPVSFQANGLPVSASDTVMFFVSTHAPRKDAEEQGKIERSAIPDAGAVAESLLAGFRSARDDVHVVLIDATMMGACFDESRESSVLLPPAPALTDVKCQTLVKERGARYLVSIRGERATTSRLELMPLGLSREYNDTFEIAAVVFDASTGARVCDASQAAMGASAVGIAFVVGVVPLPLFRGVDEIGFWRDVAFRSGRAIGWCFVQLNSK
jgi:hypothetical protein